MHKFVAAVIIGLLASPALASSQSYVVKNRRIERNETLAGALHDTGLPTPQVEGIISALEGVFDFRRSRVGDQFRLVLRAGELDFFDYRQNGIDEWQVRRDGDRLVGSKRVVEVEKKIELISLEVESSLYEAAIAAGEDPLVAMSLSDVFAWDIDFYQDVRKGDVARAVIEKFVANGRILRYGEVLAASYEGEAVGSKQVFRFDPEKGSASYFQRDGSSARKSFLKSPLKYAHVTSRFGSRFHPVLKYRRNHNGVDYGAGIGTPVWSVADGTVTRAGWDRGGGGNTLCIRHVNGWESCYLHLSKFGRGVRVGKRVEQKQVVAYTGNTGRSTGPHLHFSLKRHGRHVNPLNQNFPRAEPLPKQELPAFEEAIAQYATMLGSEAVAGLGTSAIGVQ